MYDQPPLMDRRCGITHRKVRMRRKEQLTILAVIQKKGLRMVAGAYRVTPTEVLQAESKAINAAISLSAASQRADSPGGQVAFIRKQG